MFARIRSRRCPWGAGLLAALMLLTLLPAAGAGVRSELSTARQRLAELERRITTQEDEVDRVRARFEELTDAVVRQDAEYTQIRGRLSRTRHDLRDAESDLHDVRRRIRARARAVYKYGPVGWLDVLLAARSAARLGEGVEYAARSMRSDADLAHGVRTATAALDEVREEQETLTRLEITSLRALETQQQASLAAFTEQQERLESLARDRAEALELVEQLRGQLAAEEAARIGRVAGKGMPITFGEWAEAFLTTLGAPVSRNNLVVLVTWQHSEFTRATWNPLATSYHMPGATVFNSHGVRNYASKEQGIEAAIRTLRLANRGYEPILAALFADAEPMVTGRAINASHWCRGCTGGQYVIKNIPVVEQYYERYASR